MLEPESDEISQASSHVQTASRMSPLMVAEIRFDV